MIEELERLADPIVSLDDLKAQLNIDHSDDDEKLTGYIRKAVAAVRTYANRVCAPGRYLLRVADWSAAGTIAIAPVRQIESVKYLDPDGAEQVFTDFEFWTVETGGRLTFAQCPALAARGDAIRIEFVAGYGATQGVEDILAPDDLAHAIVFLASLWHEQALPVNIGNIVNEIPFTAKALLDPWRIYR